MIDFTAYDDDTITVNADALPPHGDYYVTVRNAGRVGFLLGPYDDVRDALANVARGNRMACELAGDDRAWFYEYGTARLPIGTAGRTVFGK